MNQIKKFLFLTLKTAEFGSIRPNYLSRMKNLQKQGLLAERYFADDIDSLKKIGLDFINHPNSLSILVFSSDEELYAMSRSDLTLEQKNRFYRLG